MSTLNEPYTEEEMEAMWRTEMQKRKDSSPEFKRVMSWMFGLEEFKEVMRFAHLPNPFIKMIKKDG